MSIQEYLDLCRRDPSAHASVAERMLAAIGQPELVDSRSKLRIGAIHDEGGYRAVRQRLSEQYDLGRREPNLQVWIVDLRGDRSLTLRHFAHQRRPLDASSQTVVDHLAFLWGFAVRLKRQNDDGSVELVMQQKHEKRPVPPPASGHPAAHAARLIR